MTASTLAGSFLIAMPNLADPNFWRTVVLLGSHSADEGAFGLVVNRASDVAFAEVLRQLGLETPHDRGIQVLTGGPVEPSQGFVIVDGTLEAEDPQGVCTGGFTISGRSDVLGDLACGVLDHRFALCLGYAGWQAGQLERELEENSWLLAPADPDLVFRRPLDDRWSDALAMLGVDPGKLVDAGSGVQPS
jgi:putative transcriptional regulator